jgi:hypothetical protein
MVMVPLTMQMPLFGLVIRRRTMQMATAGSIGMILT